MFKSDFEAVTFSRPKFGGEYETVMHNDSALHGASGSDTVDLAASKVTKHSATPKSSDHNAKNVKFAPVEEEEEKKEVIKPPTPPKYVPQEEEKVHPMPEPEIKASPIQKALAAKDKEQHKRRFTLEAEAILGKQLN